MKIPAALAILPALLLAACLPSPSTANLMTAQELSLDSGDGPQPWAAEDLLPPSDDPLRSLSFTLSFRAPDAADGDRLVIGPCPWPYRAWLNGSPVASYGGKGPGERERSFQTESVALAPGILAAQNVLRVEALAGRSRAPLMELSLMRGQEAGVWAFWRNFFMIQLISASAILGLILAVYYLALFLTRGERDWRYLWFALFCIFVNGGYPELIFHGPGIDALFLVKTSRIGFLFGAAFFSFFVMESTGILKRAWWAKALSLALSTGASLVILIQRDFHSVIVGFRAILPIGVAPHLLASAALILSASLRGRFKENATLVFGFAVLLASSAFDSFYEMSDRVPYAWTLCYGYMVLVVCVFLDLALKQARDARASQAQARDLDAKNRAFRSVLVQLKDGSQIISASTDELAVSTREISVTGNQQAAAVKEIVATMEDANDLIRGIQENSSAVRESSEATARKAAEGSVTVHQALEKLEAVIGRISESISLITEFNEQLGSITEVVKLIESIATQIRIIAFNASLEAVAAGEAGKNFRIVAEEVKRLADSTMESVKNIRARMGGLITTSENVVDTARMGYVSLEQSWDIASGMGSSFSDIAEAAEGAAEATAGIDQSIHQESAAFGQILLTLKEISAGINNFVQSSEHTTETTDRLKAIADDFHAIVASNAEEEE